MELSSSDDDIRNPTPHWVIDRRVPVTLIFILFVQTIGLAWWASNITTRVADLEGRSSAAQAVIERFNKVEIQSQYMNDRIAELMVKVSVIPPLIAPARR